MTNEERAYLVATQAHANQQYDIYPYIFHLKQVTNIAKSLGYDESIIVSCVLHDVLEDTSLSYNDIKKAFGEEIAEIVYAVTDELGRNRKERKSKTYPKIRANWKATVVKICDRIANATQSKLYNPELFKMYQDENEDFKTNLMSPYHDHDKTNKAWKLLHEILEN